jgi:hypothetical protein
MLARKNLMVHPRKIERLATRLGTSQSEAVRRAVDALLLEAEVMSAARRIRERRRLKDAYGRLTRERGH